MCTLWLTDEENPASAYAHQCRTGVTTNAQRRIEFVGHTGETNSGGRLFAMISVLTRQASPTSSALIGKLRSGRTATPIQPPATIPPAGRRAASAPCFR